MMSTRHAQHQHLLLPIPCIQITLSTDVVEPISDIPGTSVHPSWLAENITLLPAQSGNGEVTENVPLACRLRLGP